MKQSLQWGGRFTKPPDTTLLAFGSSLEDDLVLAPFDVRTSHAHVEALQRGRVISDTCADALHSALNDVATEIESGAFAEFARASNAEDVHGAIDARVRERCPSDAGEWLHAGRSRNDQVATTLALFAYDRARAGARRSISIARLLLARASTELLEGTLLAAVTHWQPAQPVSLAFWLLAAAEPFVRAGRRFAYAAVEAKRFCPLGSSALAGSTLPLDRGASASYLGFDLPSRNAMDSIGTRDALLDVAHVYVRTSIDASRVAADLIVWATPAYGYVRLGDASSTGSSLMPQKRNPDPLELVRGGASEMSGAYVGALASLTGLPLSYHRDLQQTKRIGLQILERGAAMLQAFELALADITFVREAMNVHAADGYTVATDIADALVRTGVSARRAHELVGTAVRKAEAEGRALDDRDLTELAAAVGVASLCAPVTAAASVRAKVTSGSTSPSAVRDAFTAMGEELDDVEQSL
jgi:argininosuccinate lyase